MAAPPVMHVLDKVDYSKHRVVTLPSDPLPPLAPSSLRLQTKILGLTTNNLTYARLGHILGWWDIYPLPPSTPAPYNDASAYCRIAAWGYAEVIDSTVPEIPVGKTVYGFLAISTLPEDVRVEQTGLKDQIFVVNEHRQHLWKIYNRYTVYPPLEELVKTETLDFLGWDSLMQGLFATSYNMNVYGFGWEDKHRIHPGGVGEWTAEEANLDDSTVIILNAGGKTGISFAYTLRQNRPKEHQPKSIIGVGSPASKDVLQESGFYDTVFLNTEEQAAKDLVEKSGTKRVVLLDFGARAGATEAWKDAFSSSSIPFLFVAVGAEVKPEHPDVILKRMGSLPSRIQVNASFLREKGIETSGDAYFEGFFAAWNEFKKRGAIPRAKLQWGEGIEGWKDGWEKWCNDEVRASTGLVYRV